MTKQNVADFIVENLDISGPNFIPNLNQQIP